jgi:hypothetical protein
MSISVLSKTHNSITVSCSYPTKSSSTTSKSVSVDDPCTITWYWIRQNNSWVQNGWDHNAPNPRSYGPDTEGYTGSISLDSVSIGTRPSAPTSTATNGTITSKTTTGTAYFSGTVSKTVTTGATISSVEMYLNGAFYGSGAGGNDFSYTFSGLTASTTYGLSVKWFESGNDVGTNSTYETTNAPPDITPPYLSISVSEVTQNSFKVNYNAVDEQGGSGVNGYTIAVGYGADLPYESLSSRGTDYNAAGGNLIIGGASPNTWYTVGVRVIDVAGNYSTKTTNVKTLATIPSSPTVISRSEGGFTLSWSAISGATSYQLDYKPSINSVWNTVQVSGSSTSIGSLAYGLVYDFRVRAYIDSWSDYSGISNATVNPKTPTISGSYNGSTISIYTAGLSGTTFDYIVIERLNQSGTYIDQKSVTNSGDGVSWSIASNDIKNYKFRAYSTKGSLSSLSYSNYIEYARPDDFNWTGGNKTQGGTLVVLASDWNALQSRINQFRTYKGLGLTSFTSVSKGNKITAALYNQLANSINALGSTGGQIALVSQGSPLTAYAINRLTACLNTVY